MRLPSRVRCRATQPGDSAAVSSLRAWSRWFIRSLALAGLACCWAASGPGAVTAQLATQPAAPSAPVDVRFFGGLVRWQTIPLTRVAADLADATGKLKGAGNAFSDEQGRVALELNSTGDGFPGEVAIQPGDLLRLAPSGGLPTEVRVPQLSGAVDVKANRISGMAPAGSTVELDLEDNVAALGGSTWGAPDAQRPPVTRQVTADASGQFLLDGAFAEPGTEDTGMLRYRDAAGNRFSLRLGAFRAEVTAGARQITGQATAGETISVTVLSAAGDVKGGLIGQVGADGRWQVPPSGGFFFGPLRFPVIQAGDQVRFVRVGGQAAPLTVTVPNLGVAIDRQTNTVTGNGPADAALGLEALPALSLAEAGATHLWRQAVADAGGSFRVSLDGAGKAGPGWRIVVRYAVDPAVWVRAVAVQKQLWVAVSGDRVAGVGVPGQMVTVTLSSSTAQEKASTSEVVDADGLFDAQFFAFGPGGGITVQPGDRVEVAFVEGDPVLLTVPALSAHTDVGADLVEGEAPAGAAVRVVAGPTGSRLASAGAYSFTMATAAADGRYRGSFAGQVDLAGPLEGLAIMASPGGHLFYASWAAVQMSVDLSSNFVTGNGPPGAIAALKLVDPNGQVVAESAGQVYELSGGNIVLVGPSGPVEGDHPVWFGDFVDTTGHPVQIRSGDTIQATVGGESLNLVVPRLEGAALVADDGISGQGEPGEPVRVFVQRQLTGESAQAELTADGNGLFSVRFDGAAGRPTFDIQYNDAFRLNTRRGGHIISRSSLAPGMELVLDTAEVSGSWLPNMALRIELKTAAGQLRAATEAQTGPQAFYGAVLADAAGNTVEPRPGDVLTVRAVDGTGPAGREPLTLTVPELTLIWDAVADSTRGRATPGGALVVRASDLLERFSGVNSAEGRADLGADGAWVGHFLPAYDIKPATLLQADYRVPSGHRVVRRTAVPFVNAEHGGARVCGYAGSRDAVQATLNGQNGAARASAKGQVDGMSYRLVLQDAGGTPVATEPGQTVAAKLGQTTAAITLPELDVRPDWESGQITGTGPASTQFTIRAPADSCTSAGDPFGRSFLSVILSQTRPDGSFRTPLPSVDPGQGFEIGFMTPDGYRIFRPVYRAYGEIYVRTNRVSGQATALTPVSAVLRDANGVEKGRASGKADPEGRFDLVLHDASGQDVPSRPTDVLELNAAGESPQIGVEELNFDWSPGGPIQGVAPAGRTVQVGLQLRFGPMLTLDRTADTRGAFQVVAADVPPRADWTLGDVVGVRVSLRTPNGHAIVVEAKAPERANPRLFLPWLGRSAGTGRGQAQQAMPATLPPELVKSANGTTPAARVTLADWMSPSTRAIRPGGPPLAVHPTSTRTMLTWAPYQQVVRPQSFLRLGAGVDEQHAMFEVLPSALRRSTAP